MYNKVRIRLAEMYNIISTEYEYEEDVVHYIANWKDRTGSSLSIEGALNEVHFPENVPVEMVKDAITTLVNVRKDSADYYVSFALDLIVLMLQELIIRKEHDNGNLRNS